MDKTTPMDAVTAELLSLEVERRALVAQLFWLIGIAVLLILGGVGGGVAMGNPLFGLILGGGLAVLLGGIWGGAILLPAQRAFVYRFKRRIIGPIVKALGPDLEYRPGDSIPSGRFMDSQLFRQTPDRYRGEDLVRGRLGMTDLEFSEIHAEYKTESTDSKGRHSEQWHTIFRGLFFTADFHKHFNGTTVVLPDFAERSFGFLGRMMQKWTPGRGQLIQLEDPEFEKIFVVYGDDQVEARYILTPGMMERLTRLHAQVTEKTGQALCISFTGGRINLAAHCQRNLFEPKIFSPNLDTAMLDEYRDWLSLMLGIVDELQLNLRLWSKE